LPFYFVIYDFKYQPINFYINYRGNCNHCAKIGEEERALIDKSKNYYLSVV